MAFMQLRQRALAGFAVGVLALGFSAPIAQHRAEAQSIACNAVIKDPVVGESDKVLAISRLRRNNALVIGVPKDALSEKILFTTYISKGVAPFFGDYVRNAVIEFEEQGNAIFLTQTFANLTFDEESPLIRTQDASLSKSRIVGLARIPCADENFVYAQVSGNALRVLSFRRWPACSASWVQFIPMLLVLMSQTSPPIATMPTLPLTLISIHHGSYRVRQTFRT